MAPAKRKQGAKAQSGSRKTRGKPKAQRAQVRVAVDEGFTEDVKVSVYVESDGTIFDASLNQTNIGENNNKFYFLQLLKAANGKSFYTHTRWGRVGEAGKSKTMGPQPLKNAMEDFEKKFRDKSGLEWDSRHDEPQARKYTFIEKSYEDEDDNVVAKNGVTIKSELPVQTQRLLELIFNEKHFNSVLEDIGYNAEKLPLGKLGPGTLKTGFKHLQELASMIKHPSLSRNKYGMTQKAAIEDFSNKFYSTIPHAFGRRTPPLIDHDEILKREVAMLDTLTDMSVANSIMNANDKATDANAVSLLDKRFKDLKLKEMTPLEATSTEYKNLAKYLLDSSSTGHGLMYRVEDIFRVERVGEHDRFDKSHYAKLKDKNRLLLWHGSRTTNFGGILSQGLRIAPPEAPMSGYAFGKGVYLADCSSKSANYCRAAMSGGVGLLLLCEAELSAPMYEIPTGNVDAQELAKKHNCISTKGVGRSVPQAWKDASCVHESLKGVLMPEGQPGPNKVHNNGYLMYNEYIAYDVAQLRLRYLFRVSM